MTLNSAATTTVTLGASALAQGTDVKMIKICLPCRVKDLATESQFDNGLPADGVLIHDIRMNRAPISGDCFFNAQSGWAVPIDSTPGGWNGAPDCHGGDRQWPDYGLFNAMWLPGQTFTDLDSGLKIEVRERSGSSYVVAINPCDDDAGCFCGDAILSEGEQCDGGAAPWAPGKFCTSECTVVACGRPLTASPPPPKAGDALYVLSAAVAETTCDVRVCDVDSSGAVTAGDALRILRAAVGQSVTLTCPNMPACPVAGPGQ